MFYWICKQKKKYHKSGEVRLLILHLMFFCMVIFNINAQHTSITSISEKIDSGDYYLSSDIQKADRFYTNAREEASTISNDTLLGRVLMSMAVMNRYKGDYAEALQNNNQALEIFVKRNDSISISTIYHNLAVVHRYMDDLDEYENFIMKAIDLRRAIKDTIELGISLIQAGILHRKKEEFEKARAYYSEAKDLFQQTNQEEKVVHTNGSIAVLESVIGNMEKSIAINLEDIPYLEKTNDLNSLATRYSNIAVAYKKLEKLDTAIAYFDRAIAIALQEDYHDSLRKYYLERSRIYNKKKDYKKAFEDYRYSIRYRDSVRNLENIQKIAEAKTALEYQMKQQMDSIRVEKEMAELSHIAERESLTKKLLFILFLIACLAGVGIWKYFQNKKKLVDSELEREKLNGKLLEKELKITQDAANMVVQENHIKTEVKETIVHELKHILPVTKDPSANKAVSGLIKKLNQQLRLEKEKMTDGMEVRKANQVFEQKLISLFPELTKNERKLCSLIRMELSVKEISQMNNMSIDAIKSMRYRIRKKMGLDRKEELTQVLKSVT